jgi:hypothetical protein
MSSLEASIIYLVNLFIYSIVNHFRCKLSFRMSSNAARVQAHYNKKVEHSTVLLHISPSGRGASSDGQTEHIN